VAQGRRVGLFGPDAQKVGEGLDLAPPSLSKHFAKQAVTGSEVVDQHPLNVS
jgi:hypothetical protein